ncbi:MAG: hypothetical protein JWP02_3562 [Acidimicrobiales bacterium]|nr:hypothetical protein [Acidimicrobiales bacterium]
MKARGGTSAQAAPKKPIAPSAPGVGAPMGMSSQGEVTGVRMHSGGKHVVVEVAHGRRTKPKVGGKGPRNQPFAPDPGYDNRPSSSVVVPKARASHFPVGQRVSMSMAQAGGGEGDDGDMGEDLDQMNRRLTKMRKS